MNKYVPAFLCVLLMFLTGAAVFAQEPFYNGNLIKDRSDETLLNRRIFEKAYPESAIPEPKPEPRMDPPKDFARPLVTYSDSISSESSIVKKYREIKGLRVDPYSIMTYDQYLKRNLEKNFYKTWQDPKKRLSLWSEVAKEGGSKGGMTDLDFVLPGSKSLERFVGGETRINIDGREKITFSGRSEWTEGQIETSVSKNSSFPALTMKQEPSFTIKGDVGRLNINIKQDPTSGQFSNLEENINLKYQGEDRDIIKLIEAGNTSLSLEGATFAGYRGTHKGLFGIRAEGQLGPMKFTTIASQEKSEANVKTYRGKAEESSNKIKDYEYKTNTYFYVDFQYRDRFVYSRTSFDLIPYVGADSLAVIEIYEDDANIANNLQEGTFALRGVAYPMDMRDKSTNPELGIEGYYHKLEPVKDYYVDRSLGYIRFTRRVPDQSTIGVYIKTRDGREFGSLNYKTDDPNSKINLKLIKKKMQLPTDTKTWDLEWKNVYDLNQRQIEPEGFEVRIYREATDGVSKDTQNGVPFIQILGLDKKDELGNDKPDNKIDLNRGFIDFYNGELMFPDPQPFNQQSALPGVTTALTEKVPKIYNTQNRQEMEEASRYYIEVKTSSRQATIQIGSGMMSIMEGTEQVILNGKPLSKGKDYRIDYNTGKITLLSEEAQSPTADLQIRYEEPNAFQEMQKTLLGFRTEFDILSNSKIGAVTLFKNESTKDRRVKLGQEPSQMFLFDTDAQFNFESRTVSNILDMLPGLQASERSTFKIETEFARSMPTLNTRGVVYIDDFEGSQNTPIGVVRSKWTIASIPDSMTTGGKPLKRGRLQWYNPWNRVKSKDIWPNKETSAGENTVHVLNLGYGKPAEVPNSEAFAGVQTSFYGAGEDLSRSRFIEIWARGSKGELKFDIGSISEDSIPNGTLDTEDKPIPGQGHGDGVLTKEEDTGLDGMFDNEEKAYFLDLAAGTTDPSLKRYYQERAALDDPSGDNFFYKSGDKNNYIGLNGTEGNASDGDRLGFPDTEDINNNGILDVRNNYYEYTISFSDPLDRYLVQDSVPEGEPHGWRLFRIPLWSNPNAVVGGLTPPDSTLIEFARMWITNTDSTLIQIASIQVVESAWLEQGIEGENILIDNVRVTNANTHENLDYSPPPGVKAEIDRETKIRKKEQSLVIKTENLQPGNTALIYRTFQKMNFTDYTSMKMYAHGPDIFPTGAGDSDYELVFRFGADKDNYYEYRTPMYKGWDTKNAVDIDFAQCTRLKLMPWKSDYLKDASEVKDPDAWYTAMTANPDSVDVIVGTWYDTYLAHAKFVDAVEDTIDSKVYAIKGRPSLDNIKTITIGIKNGSKFQKLTCDVWLDELRMDAERDMTGNAARININSNFAGFLSVVAGATRKEDDFHDMNSKSGTGQDNTDWNANISMNLDRFAPARWNLRLPVSASMNESSALPRLKSGSDIILSDSQKNNYETTSGDKKYRVSYSKSRDSSQDIIDSFSDFKTLSVDKLSGTLVHWSLDKVNASYDFGERTSESPFSGSSLSDTKQAKVGYDVNPKEIEKKVKLLNWLPSLPFERWEKLADMDFSLTPSQLNYSYSYNESNQYQTNVDAVSDTTMNKTAEDALNFGFDPINALKYTYTRSSSSDLYLKQQVSYMESNKITLSGPTMLYLQNSYSYSANYNETDNPRYSLANTLGSKTIKLDKSFSFTGSLEVNKFFEDISGKPKPPKTKFKREKQKEEEWKPTESASDSTITSGDKKLDEKRKREDEKKKKKAEEKRKKEEEKKKKDEEKRLKEEKKKAEKEKKNAPKESIAKNGDTPPAESSPTAPQGDTSKTAADSTVVANKKGPAALPAPGETKNAAPAPQNDDKSPGEAASGDAKSPQDVKPVQNIKPDDNHQAPPKPGQAANQKVQPEKQADTLSKNDKKKGDGLRTKLLMGVSKSLTPVSLDVSKSDGINYGGIAERPDFMSRFGQGSIDGPDSMTVVTRQNAESQTTNYSARTKINLPFEMGLSLSSKFSDRATNSPSANASSETKTPVEMAFNWNGLDRRIPFINKAVSGLNLNSSYATDNSKNWQNEELRSAKTTVKFAPLFNVTTQVFKKLQLSFSFNTSKDNTDDYSGSTISYSETREKSTSTSLRYVISSSSGFALFRRLNLKSDIDLSLTFTTTSSQSFRGINQEPMAMISSNDAWSLGPKAEYKFSSKFRGGMQMQFNNSIDMTKKVRKVREVSIWGEMMF